MHPPSLLFWRILYHQISLVHALALICFILKRMFILFLSDFTQVFLVFQGYYGIIRLNMKHKEVFMKEKVRILGIAPYAGLVELMKQYARQRPDVELHAVLGNMEDGVLAAREQFMDYDIIISRANTASMISRALPTPVVDIGIGFYDVLRCIKMAESTKTKFAVMGFHSLTTIARTIGSLLKTPIDIFPISTPEEANLLLHRIKDLGYETVLCDTVSFVQANLVGITPILLTSSIESLQAAVDQAVHTYEMNRALHQSLNMFRNIIKNGSSQYLILDEKEVILFSSLRNERAASICARLKKELPVCIEEKKRSFFINAENVMYSVHSSLVEDAPVPYVVFSVTGSGIPLSYSKYGISILNRQEADDSYQKSLYSKTELARKFFSDIENMDTKKAPLMIVGEVGTGKDHAAHIYYARSQYSSNPLYVINCAFLSEKSWNFIIDNYNSPLTDNDNTIYIANIDCLPQSKQKKLLTVILDTNLHTRNCLILSCTMRAGQNVPHVAMEYMNALGCVLLSIKPLREQRADITASAGLYIDTLNQAFGKQVVGIDDDALKLLENYDFPCNRTQFKRILKEAVLNTATPYISADTIRFLLNQEASLIPSFAPLSSSEPEKPETDFALDLNQPLDSMNRDIIQYILKGCKGNQTAAAKKLGISRTTMWRYLNRQ